MQHWLRNDSNFNIERTACIFYACCSCIRLCAIFSIFLHLQRVLIYAIRNIPDDFNLTFSSMLRTRERTFHVNGSIVKAQIVAPSVYMRSKSPHAYTVTSVYPNSVLNGWFPHLYARSIPMIFLIIISWHISYSSDILVIDVLINVFSSAIRFTVCRCRVVASRIDSKDASRLGWFSCLDIDVVCSHFIGTI